MSTAHHDDAETPALSAITIFTGSALGDDPAFAREARRLAEHLVREELEVVYGGGNVGLMGVVADAARSAGGRVRGVIPEGLVRGEIAHEGLDALEVVPDMHRRKQRMNELGDAFVALPGGAGTLEELFEMWTWQQLGFHRKPVAVYDVGGFWSPMLAMLDEMVARGFIRESFRNRLIVASEPEELLGKLRTWRPAAPKWGR